MWFLDNFIALSNRSNSNILFFLFFIFTLSTQAEARQISKDGVRKNERNVTRNLNRTVNVGQNNCEMSDNLYDARRIAAFQECSLIFKPLLDKDKEKENEHNSTMSLQDISKHVKNQNQSQNQHHNPYQSLKSNMEFNMSNIDETLNNFVEDLSKTILSRLNSSQLQQLMAGGVRKPRVFPCMMACMIHKLKFVDETGRTNETVIVEQSTSFKNSTLTPETTKSIIRKCYDRTNYNGTHIGKKGEEKINLDFNIPAFSSNSCRVITGFGLCMGMSAYEHCKNSTTPSSS